MCERDRDVRIYQNARCFYSFLCDRISFVRCSWSFRFCYVAESRALFLRGRA